VFKSSIAKILIIVLFFKIILIMDFEDCFIPKFFLASFQPSSKLPQHTCRPFPSHQCAIHTYIHTYIHKFIVSQIRCPSRTRYRTRQKQDLIARKQSCQQQYNYMAHRFKMVGLVGLRKTSESISQDSLCPNWDFNWKGCGRTWSWPIFRYYPGICLEDLRKAMKNLSQTGYLTDTNQGCYHLSQPAPSQLEQFT
jgi:hypothetical protein